MSKKDKDSQKDTANAMVWVQVTAAAPVAARIATLARPVPTNPGLFTIPFQATPMSIAPGSIIETFAGNVIANQISGGAFVTLIFDPSSGPLATRPVLYLETAMPVSTIDISIAPKAKKTKNSNEAKSKKPKKSK